ncbi:hypothetical protein PAXINDRAFT_96030 [Paxillus involutus ATCC 200175]|nr:hypothetical protein PAXINDRAFT_96030 [Paxillus involutus ATCC 200175]
MIPTELQFLHGWMDDTNIHHHPTSSPNIPKRRTLPLDASLAQIDSLGCNLPTTMHDVSASKVGSSTLSTIFTVYGGLLETQFSLIMYSDDPDSYRFINFSLPSHLTVRVCDKVPRGPRCQQ